MTGVKIQALLRCVRTSKDADLTTKIIVEGASVAGQTRTPGRSPVGTADNNRAISVPGEKPAGKPKKIRGAVDSRFDDGAEYGESYAVQYDSPETREVFYGS